MESDHQSLFGRVLVRRHESTGYEVVDCGGQGRYSSQEDVLLHGMNAQCWLSDVTWPCVTLEVTCGQIFKYYGKNTCLGTQLRYNVTW